MPQERIWNRPHVIVRSDGSYYRLDAVEIIGFADELKDAEIFPSHRHANSTLWAWQNIGMLNDCEIMPHSAASIVVPA
jgi:hypothetical protein